MHHYTDSLRDGTHEMFNDLNALKVPVLVFSAGIGDTVQAMLHAADVLMPTVKVRYSEEFYLNLVLKNLFRSGCI